MSILNRIAQLEKRLARVEARSPKWEASFHEKESKGGGGKRQGRTSVYVMSYVQTR